MQAGRPAVHAADGLGAAVRASNTTDAPPIIAPSEVVKHAFVGYFDGFLKLVRMLIYSRIPIWENRRRVTALAKFRQLATDYYSNLTFPSWMAGTNAPNENAVAAGARTQINFVLGDIGRIIFAAGLRPVLTWTPPTTVGGYVQNVSIFENLFGLHQYQIPPNQVLDFIDRALGVYEHDKTRSLLRTINPFYWIGFVFDFVASTPFRIARRAGFDAREIENTLVGRTVRLLIYVIEAIAAILTALYYLGVLDLVLTRVGFKSPILPPVPKP